jgi:hypothetical protein
VPNTPDFLIYYTYLIKHSNSQVEIEDLLLTHTNPSDKYLTFKVNQLKVESKRKTIFLYAQSDTLANSCSLIYESLNEEHDCFLIYPCYKDEGAQAYFEQNNYKSLKFSPQLLKKEKPDLLILLNDWAKEAKRVMAHCNLLKMPTICIQESIIDFGDHFKRMTFSDYAFVQGVQTVLDLDRKQYFLTGNPRYKLGEDDPPNCLRSALINCNFTYGIYEEVRDSWLKDITSVLDINIINYKISQHPRDNGTLSEYQDKIIKSSSASVSSQISEADIIFTRFSSLIHEGILQKKYVIYYNPHQEKMQYNFRFNSEFLFLCNSPLEIEKALKKIIDSSKKGTSIKYQEYSIEHCLPIQESPVQNIKKIISQNVFKAKISFLRSCFNVIIYHPSLLRVYRKLK